MKILVFLILTLANTFVTTNGQLEIPGNPTIYSDDQNQYLDASNIDNPIRDGAYDTIQNNADNIQDTDCSAGACTIKGLLGSSSDGDNYEQIQDHQTAQDKTLRIVKNLINYALGMVTLVALVYLIYHGVLMITAAGDDAQYKKGMKGLKFAAIAIVGIGLSWFIVSFIFRIIQEVMLNGAQ